MFHSLPDPHGLHQLGVGYDQVLPVDEKDGDLLLSQDVGSSDWFDEYLRFLFTVLKSSPFKTYLKDQLQTVKIILLSFEKFLDQVLPLFFSHGNFNYNPESM